MMAPAVELREPPANCFEAFGFIPPLVLLSAALSVSASSALTKRTYETAYGYLRSRFFDSLLGGHSVPGAERIIRINPYAEGIALTIPVTGHHPWHHARERHHHLLERIVLRHDFFTLLGGHAFCFFAAQVDDSFPPFLVIFGFTFFCENGFMGSIRGSN